MKEDEDTYIAAVESIRLMAQIHLLKKIGKILYTCMNHYQMNINANSGLAVLNCFFHF